jgi:hypothetical protein
MHHMWARVGTQLLARVSGPLKFRLVLQPAMACYLAIRSGLADAKKGKPPYFWALLWDPRHRFYMIKEGWKSIGRVFLLAVAIDVIYQLIVLKFVYPGEAIIVAFVLAIVPYLILRGPVNRMAQRRRGQVRAPGKQPPMSDAA